MAKKVVKQPQKLQAPERSRFDLLKWGLVLLLAVAGIAADLYFVKISPSLRSAAWLLLMVIMLFVAVQTTKGQQFWRYAKEARNEIRRVTWPTRQATLQMTMIVALMVCVSAILIFIFDQLFLWLVGLLIGQEV
ncbi:MAG: preprotein translocase subunit SecE [Gammaproteobacteria bacterium]|nr:preprotein translocase subunit SecE [Gammaproteobacteria bacterium]